MKYLSIPPQLQNLPAAKNRPPRRPKSQSGRAERSAEEQTARSYRSASSVSAYESSGVELPRALTRLSKTALEVGLAMKYIPAQFSRDQTIFQAADEVDHVVDAITDYHADVIDGTGLTQMWNDVSCNSLVWVSCEILKKVDTNKFLIFINENASQKVVSTENLIFQNVILLTYTDSRDMNGSYEVRRDIIEVRNILQPFFGRDIDSVDYIEIFRQQKTNFYMRQRFEEAIRRFGELSISMTKEQFEQYDDYTEFAVVNMQNTRLHDMKIPDNTMNAERVLLLRKQVQSRVNQSYRVPLNKQQVMLDKIISYSVTLCTEAINTIDFDKIKAEDTIFDFEEVQMQICQEFIQEAQLVDSYLLILRYAKNDETNELHWCSGFLSVFLWSRFKIFQNRNLFDYCFGIEVPDESNTGIFEAHKHQFERSQIIVSSHLQKIYSKTFMALRHYIQLTFEQHYEYIMASATKLISTIWTNELPYISNRVSESFIQHFSHKGINQFFLQVKTKGNLKNLSFKYSFSEKLINTHKVVYYILTPHLVDYIMQDFAYEVLQILNDKLHKYQSSHGKTPSLKMRDQFAEASYRTTHDKYVQIFKIMQITFLKIFIDELYETALPQWFYFLLALVHGGKKRYDKDKDQDQKQADITRFLHVAPNDQNFYSSLQKDIDSLNKFTDFKIPYDKAIGKKVLYSLSQLEFALLPIIHDNFVSGVQFTPDPLQMAKKLEECIQELHVYYSSSPKFSDILIFDVATNQVKNKLTLYEREMFIDKNNLSYKQYLEIAYNQAALGGGSEGNPFNLSFLQPDGYPKHQKGANKFITLTNSKFRLHEAEEEEFEFDIKVETRLAEAIYYEPSILLQKLVRLSKMAGEKLYKYFDYLQKFFCNHIYNLLEQITNIFEVDNLLPHEITSNELYQEILSSIQQNTKMLKIQGTNEEQIKLRMKPISDFLHTEQILAIVSEQFKCGNAPPGFIQSLLNDQIQESIEIIGVIYQNMYNILALPNICYYSTFRVNLTYLLNALQLQDRLLFDSYSYRLEDYFCIATNIMNSCLGKISEKLSYSTFSSASEIGEIYEICKLFVFNKDKWVATYQQLDKIIERYEQLPMGTLSVQHYNAMSAALYKSQMFFKRVFQGQSQVTTRVGEAYYQAFAFISNIYYGFDTLILEIFQRVQEYFNISYQDWTTCMENQASFKQKYPLLTTSVKFPKALKLDEYSLIDIKRLVREIENTSQMPVFKANHIKVHIFERFYLFKQDNLNDAFQELDDLISRSIDTLKLLLQLKQYLLGSTEIEYFDSIDKFLFGTQQKKDYYVYQLKNQGETIDLNRDTMSIIVSASQQSANQLSKLLNLQPVFYIAYKLVNICSNLPASYGQWLDQSLSIVHLDEVRRYLIDAIKISTLVLHKFNHQYKIVTLAENLLHFLQSNNTNFRLVFMTKTAVYENTIQTFDRDKTATEIIRRPHLDEIIKLDSHDFAINSTLINTIIQSVNFKISDDVYAHELIGVLQPYVYFIFIYASISSKRARFEKLMQLQQQEINKLLLGADKYFIIEPQFELPTSIKREKPKLLLEENQYGSIGVDLDKIRMEYKCYYCREYKDDPLFSNNVIFISRSNFFENWRSNQLVDYLNQQKSLILASRFNESINSYQAQLLLNYTDSLLQMIYLHWHVYIYCQQIYLLAEIAEETYNSNFEISKLTSEQTEKFQQIIKQFRGLLTGCYTTASNAYQLAQRKFVKDKLWEYSQELYFLLRGVVKVNLPYFCCRSYQNQEFLVSILVDLIWCDNYFSPVLESSQKCYNGALIYLLPDEINNSIMSMLSNLGIYCAGFNILYFLFKTPDGKSQGYYYIDGLTFIQNVYFKFVYPLIFQNQRDIYLHLTIERLQRVILATLEFHMLHWQQAFAKDSSMAIRQILLFYPYAISFFIISQLIVDQMQTALSVTAKHEQAVGQLYTWLTLLSDIFESECDIYEAANDSDLTSMQQQSAQSMFISLESYFFFTPKSQFEAYAPARQFKYASNPVRAQNSSRRKVPQSDSNSGTSAIIDLKTYYLLDVVTDSDSAYSSDSARAGDMRTALHSQEGWSADVFAELSLQTQQSAFKPEHITVIYYLVYILQQFLSNLNGNSCFSEFCLPYSNGNYEYLAHYIKKHINELKRGIFDGKRFAKDFEYSTRIQLFCDGAFCGGIKGNLKTYCQFQSQLNVVSQMLLGHLVPNFISLFSHNKSIACITPNIDKYYYPQLNCLLIDGVQLLMQRKVIQFHLAKNCNFAILQHFIENGDIIIVSGAESCEEATLNTFKHYYRKACQTSRSCFVIVLPSLFINEVDYTSIQLDAAKLIASLNFKQNQIFKLDDLFSSSKQQEYEQLVISMSQLPEDAWQAQNVVNLIFKSNQISMQDRAIKFCYLSAQQNKFNQQIMHTIASMIIQCFPGVFPPTLSYEELAKQIMSADPFVFRLFPICEKYTYGGDGHAMPKKYAQSIIPQQLSSFVYMPRKFVDQCQINTQGWRYIADIVLMVFSANIQQLGVLVSGYQRIIQQQISHVLAAISMECIEFSTRIVNGSEDFGFDYDNQISILQNVLYIINYEKNEYSDNLDYISVIEEFLAQQKPVSTFVVVISNDARLLQKYCGFKISVGDNIMYNRALLKEVVNRLQYKEILLSDINILNQQNLTPTEFSYVFSKFSITWEQRQTQEQIRDILSSLYLDLLDLMCIIFQFNDVVSIKSFLAVFFSLLEMYGFAQPMQHIEEDHSIMGFYHFHVSDTFLTQIAFSSRGLSDALGKITVMLFLIAFAACQALFSLNRTGNAQDQRQLEQNYQSGYSNIILNKSSQQYYVYLVGDTLQKLNAFSFTEYTDTISKTLPLPFSQQYSTKGADFSNRFEIYLPQPSCIRGVGAGDLQDLREQLVLFESGYHTDKLFSEIVAVKTQLPYRYIVHRNYQIKSELFLTDSSTKESRIKSFFQLFGQLYELGNDYQTTLVFVLFCIMRFNLPVLLYSRYAMWLIDTVYNRASMCLHERLRSYQNIQMLFQNREYSELKLLSYNIAVPSDIFNVVMNIRGLVTLKGHLAIFNIFTLIRLYVPSEVFQSDILTDLLKKCVQFPNVVGYIEQYYLCNCGFVVAVKDNIGAQRFKNDRIQVFNCDWCTIEDTIFGVNPLNRTVTKLIMQKAELDQDVFNTIERIKHIDRQFEHQTADALYFSIHFAQSAQISLPFLNSLMNSTLVDARNSPPLFGYIGEAYNIGLLQMYHNRLLFGCIYDASRAEFKEHFQEMYEKYKNDQLSLYDFNDEIVEEASHFRYFVEAACLPMLQTQIPFHFIRMQSLFTYKQLISAISIITDSIPDIPIEQVKIRAKNLMIDVGNACWTEKFIHQFFTQNFVALSTRDKIISCIRVVISTVLGLQKGQPYPYWSKFAYECQHQYLSLQQELKTQRKLTGIAADKLQAENPWINFGNHHCFCTASYRQAVMPCYYPLYIPFIPTSNNQTYNVTQPVQMQNYDTFKYINKKQAYDYVILIIPLSLLVAHGMLNFLIDFVTPGNQVNYLFTDQELVDICQEAGIFAKLENITPAVVQMLMALKVQIFIVQDVPFDTNLLPNFVNYVNVMGLTSTLRRSSFFNLRFVDVIKFNNQCSEKFVEQYQKRFKIKNLEQLVVDCDLKICVLANYAYSNVIKTNNYVPIYSIISVVLFLHEAIKKKQNERKQMYRELYSKIHQVFSVCRHQTEELEHFKQQLNGEMMVQQSLQETQASLAKINNDLQCELNQIMKQLTLSSTKAQHMQQKIDQLRKNYQSLILQNNFELEQISKTEILDLYNSNISNPVMLYVFQVIWYIVDNRKFDNLASRTYPEESSCKQLWRDIQNEMFQKIAIPYQLQTFEYQHLEQDKVELIRETCGLPDFANQMLSFTETRLQRKLVNYILALNNYFNNLIDENEDLELKQLKQTNEYLEKKRQYLKDEQQGTKIKMGNNQKMIDQCNVRVDQFKDQVNQQQSVVKTAEFIREFFAYQQNDVIFDIGECDSQINVGPYSAIIMAFVIFFGFDVVQSLIGLLTPPKGGVCYYCQNYNVELCQHCQQCRCLCTCLHEIDEDCKLYRSAKKSPTYQLTFPVNSKENIIDYMGSLNQTCISKRSAHDTLLGMGADALLELHSLAFFSQCYQNRCIAVSLKYFERFIPIIEQVPAFYSGQMLIIGDDVSRLRAQLAEFAIKDTVQYVVLCVLEQNSNVLSVLSELVAYNTAVLRNDEQVVTIGQQKIKITPYLKCLRVYLVFYKQTHLKFKNDYVSKSLILMSASFLKNQDQAVLHDAVIMRDEKLQNKLLSTGKEQANIVVQRYLEPTEMNEYAQAIFDVRQLEMQYFSHILSIIQQCKQLKQDAIGQYLTIMQQSINNMNAQQYTIKKYKQFYQEQQTRLVELFRDKTSMHNQYYYATLQMMRLLNDLTPYFPVIAKAIDENIFARSQQVEIQQTTAPYTQILRNLVAVLSGCMSLEDIELVVFICVIYLEMYLQLIQNVTLQILMLTISQKLASTKANFREMTSTFDAAYPLLNDIYEWYKSHPDDFALAFEQENPFAYVQLQNAKPTIPQFLKARQPSAQLFLLILAIHTQKQFNLQKSISQFLRTTINYAFIFENTRSFDNKYLFSHIAALAKQGPVLLITRSIPQTIENVLHLAKVSGQLASCKYFCQLPGGGPEMLHIIPIETSDLDVLSEAHQSGGKDLIMVMAAPKKLMVELHDARTQIIDFDSCLQYNEIMEERVKLCFASGGASSGLADEAVHQLYVVQSNSPFAEWLLLLYLSTEQLLLYMYQNRNVEYDQLYEVQRVLSKFGAFQQFSKLDQEAAGENLTQLYYFIERFSKDSQKQLTQVLKHHDEISYVQQYFELRPIVYLLLHLNLFHSVPPGIIVKAAALIRQLGRDTVGSVAQSLQELEKQPIYTRHANQMKTAVIVLRFLEQATKQVHALTERMAAEFSAKELYRSELAAYFQELVAEIQHSAQAIPRNNSLTSSISRNLSSASLNSTDKEESSLKQVNFSEIFSSRTNVSYHVENTQDEQTWAILVSQTVRHDQKHACWGERLVGVEIAFQYSSQKFKHACLVEVDGMLYSGKADFEPYGIVVRSIE